MWGISSGIQWAERIQIVVALQIIAFAVSILLFRTLFNLIFCHMVISASAVLLVVFTVSLMMWYRTKGPRWCYSVVA